MVVDGCLLMEIVMILKMQEIQIIVDALNQPLIYCLYYKHVSKCC